jgi:5-methylcytosine-specific restriction endonuclease McrA
LIKKFYQGKCFRCERSDVKLHIDHIVPQSKGGDAAFRNLQPLCEKCGNEKGDDMPSDLEFYSDLYFGPYPSDSYEGLFW